MTIMPDLDRRFREAATREGLLDVAYDTCETPLGTLLLAVSPRGLCRIAFDPEPECQLEALSLAFGVRVLRSPRALDEPRRQLDEYFDGRRRTFDLQLDLAPVSSFHREVLERLAHVPYGRLTTYGTLARETGRPAAARAIGTAMNRNPIPIVLPCHRVVGSTGKLVGYGGGLERKETLLRLEGALAT